MKNLCFFIIFLFLASNLYPQPSNPHILVNQTDKQLVLAKIKNQKWSKSIFERMKSEVGPYCDRHKTDKEWILSRYLMNRIPGKRFTRVYSDSQGQRLVKWEGDAPVPTVRVNTYLRSPITEKGTSYRKPTIEELVPNDTSRLMFLYNPETSQKEWVDPEAYITDINGDINDLAQDAAILYWLTGLEEYAVFAADILNQWAQGAYYQEPVVGPCRTGFLDMQTLGDASYRPLIIAYDFIKPFMKQRGYNLIWYETVFEKIASTLVFRGFWDNNWYAAESSTMVFAALSLENKQKRDYYLQFFLEKDTTRGGCGQLALPSTVERWLTHDGHWKEPGGYHNYPVGNLLISALALEKNGYDVFRKFPALFRASFAMLKYSFPNLTVSAFGDTGRASQSAESLEIGILGALKYNQPELPEMLASMKKLVEGGKYNRERSGMLGLLCFLPEIPDTKEILKWPRTGELDFARYYFQRNGTDLQTALMVGVQGATYNHNHCNGMAMELYGLGEVMGIDAGTGANYEHPMHRNYYSQWAAHNTVVSAGASSSVPFSGSAGTKRIGQIERVAMEPMPDKEAVSENYSFTQTRYFDNSTKTNQLRTLAIVRTSPSTGYYVDIYRSDNTLSNDYIYHNIGEKVELIGYGNEIIETQATPYPLTGNDYPGFRFYSEVKKLSGYSGNLKALFTVKENENQTKYMQVLISGSKDRDYFTAYSPKVKTAGAQYNGKTIPLFTIRSEKEAWENPFVALFEPYRNKPSVLEINLIRELSSKTNTALRIKNADEREQLIFQGNDTLSKTSFNKTTFQGVYGFVSLKDGQPECAYLACGKELNYNGTGISTENSETSAEIRFTGNREIKINSNGKIVVIIKKQKVDKPVLISENRKINVLFSENENSVMFIIPKVKNGILKW